MKKQVKINGLRQNCYVSDVLTDTIAHRIKPPRHYVELKEKITDNGYIQELEKMEYPITSESVTSYVDSADYRRDPMQAVANAPKRVNLGDITQVQDFIAQDPMQAVRVYKEVGEQLAKYYEQVNKQTATATPAEEPAKESK